MVDMKFLSASTVTYACRSCWRGLTERVLAMEFSEASCASGGAGASVAGALSLRARAQVASLTTIVHYSLPTDGAKFGSVNSWDTEDDKG